MQRLSVVIQCTLIAMAALLLAMLTGDLIDAWNAPSCAERIAANCYPWGGEGPAADAGWHYASKKNYLTSSVFSLTVLVLGLLAAVWLRSGKRIAALAAALALVASSNIFLPWIFAAR